ncbi:NADP-dependent oxidoreductase [Undibacterium sp. TJN25]|uniref:NADP-dependent oxidoreductase n=1 Tax=Undibacterium sp. TJN25 TaxID=3413056 RepID=UPI003BF3A288
MNRALRIHQYGSADAAKIDAVLVPLAAAGEVVVRVHAAGVNGLDWKIRDGTLQQVFQLPLPITLGIELAGEVVQTGKGVSGFKVGDRIMGALGGLGAYADHVAVAADKLALIPAGLDEIRAAAIPVAALTAWQALFETGRLQTGQAVLIHGAAGGVGSFAVQFARRAGARVIATAQGVNAAYLRALGADQVVDYRNTDFRDHVHDVDLVLDLVGGATLADSWQVLAAGGRIVSTAAPEIVATAPSGKLGFWFQMRPDGSRLAEIAAQVAAGKLKVEVSEVATLADAPAVIERNKTGHGPGKAVIRFI